jgi:hypothetical protein
MLMVLTLVEDVTETVTEDTAKMVRIVEVVTLWAVTQVEIHTMSIADIAKMK